MSRRKRKPDRGKFDLSERKRTASRPSRNSGRWTMRPTIWRRWLAKSRKRPRGTNNFASGKKRSGPSAKKRSAASRKSWFTSSRSIRRTWRRKPAALQRSNVRKRSSSSSK